MYYINSRYLKYESASGKDVDYGTVSMIINDKLINVNMGGSSYVLEAVTVAPDYVPKLGDWVTIEWKNGNPVAHGGGAQSGLNNINDDVKLVSPSDMASGVVNSDHIKSNTIEARHIIAGSIEAEHISSNTIEAQHITADAIQAQHISANAISTESLQAGAVTADKIAAGAITATNISANTIDAINIKANAIQAQHISAGSIQSDKISANTIQAGHIQADSIQTKHIVAGNVTADKIAAGAINAGHISAGSIEARNISANAIQAYHISANTVQANHISANSVQTAHLKAGSVTADKIAAGAITSDKISANTIQANNISANAIQTQHLSANAVTADKIAAGAITSDHISAGSIQTEHISANTIDGYQIQAFAIESYHISAGTIQAQNISANAIQTEHISANAVTAGKIAAGAISANNISANSIQTQHISAGSVTSDKIAAGAINAGSISAGAITSDKISANAIQANHISAGAVTAGKIAADAISAANISANQITTKHISAGSITADKIAAGAISAGSIGADSIQAQHISANAIDADAIQAGAVTAGKIAADAIQATNISANSVLARNISANQVQSQHISAGTIISNHISAGSIQTNHISANTVTAGLIKSDAIQTQHITAGSVTSDKIAAGAITASQISANVIDARHISANAIQSQHISANAIQTQHISANAVTADKIAAGAITASSISANVILSQHISANQIQSYHISANSIQTQHISANAIQANQISANAVIAGKIAANAISANNIQAGAITTASLSANAVTADKIAAGTIQAQNISANAIQSNHISANSIQSKHIAADAIIASQISANQINASHISANSIQTQHISANAITSDKIAAGAIQANQISANAIQSQHISANVIQGYHITSNSIDANQIKAGVIQAYHISANSIQTNAISANAITADKIATDAIDARALSANSVWAEHISANSVTTEKIAANAIQAYQISANQITSAHISANVIQTPHLSANVVTSDKIASDSVDTRILAANAVMADNISANQIQSAHISAGVIKATHMSIDSIQASSISANAVTAGKISADAISANNIQSNAIQTRHLGADVIQAQHISANAVDANAIQANAITSVQISAGAVTAGKLGADAVYANNISADAIQARNISANAVQTRHISANTIVTSQIQADAITSALISANAVQTEHISANSIIASQIQIDQVNATHISANAVQSEHISANAIQTQHISANAVTAGKIAVDAIQAQHISANAIDTSSIQANAVTSDKIAANSIQAYQISANAVNANSIAADAIQTVHLSANVVTSAKIATDSVDTRILAASAVQADNIGANAIQSNHISAGVIQAQHLSANAVTTNIISANAVTAGKVATDAISANNIQSNSIQTRHLGADIIQAQHISANAVDADAIQANAITSVQISANAVIAGKIGADAVNANNIAANAVLTRNISANAVQTQHISANTITTSQIKADAITSDLISANAVQTQHISANSIYGNQIVSAQITGDHIKAGVIESYHISANTIQAVNISANAVTTDKIAANAVQAQHLSANSVTTNAIQANAITTVKLATDSVDTRVLAASSVQADNISANAVQTQHISANTITSSQIKADAVQAVNISANAVQSEHISANSISSNQIVAGGIQSVNLATDAVQTQNISANSIQTRHISANTIIGSMIQSDSVDTRILAANAVMADNISSNQVQTQHISANAVQTQHISANTITSAQIKANAITTVQISANSITGDKIVADSIQTLHISANAVQSDNISANAVQTQHISANTIIASQIKADQVNATHISANAVQSEQISANAVQSQHISANSIQTQHISANAITGDKIAAGTISGGNIIAGTIEADQLSVGARQQGLLGQYYTYTGNPSNRFQTYKGSQIDPNVNFSWGTGNANVLGQSDNFAVRWQGFIYAPESGTYSFHLVADDNGKIVVNNQTVVNQTAYMSGNEQTGTIQLTQGTYYTFLAEMTEGAGGATAIIKWTKPSGAKEVIPSKYFTANNTMIDGTTIMTGTVSAGAMIAGTITATSGVIANAAITTAMIADGNITNAKIGNAEISTAKIQDGAIINAKIQDATIQYAKIGSVDASTITVGYLRGSVISANTITGYMVQANTISGNHIVSDSIDARHIKSGAITATEIAAHSITSREISSGAITSDAIRAGSITAEHISTIGLDAQIVQVYNSQTGETLMGGGYLRVDGLDVGVIQSDNLAANGLFLTSSSEYGFSRSNPSGVAVLGNSAQLVGAHQLWKIDLTTGQKVKTIDIPAKQPFDVAIHPSGNYAYVSVQGDNTLLQIDLVQDVIGQTLTMQTGPARLKWVGDQLSDHKHFFVLNTDPMDMNIPDSISVIDTPPNSINGDLYLHHNIVLGNNPYDFVLDDNEHLYITMASQGDIVMIDASSHDSHTWKVKGRIPISAYGTDNYHGGLTATFGLNEVTGGDSASQYDSPITGMNMDMAGMHIDNGYGHSDGTFRTYEPHGIALSSDSDTLYVLDYENGELVVVDKHGYAPYNALTGRDNSSESPATSRTNGEMSGGGPRTFYVRYRIPVGDSPDFIEVVGGKLFISLEGQNSLAVIDEQSIINEIQADRNYYGNYIGDGTFEKWNVFQPMRVPTLPTPRIISNVGTKPSRMEVVGTTLYVVLSGQNQVAVVNTSTEKVSSRINTGANPKGFAITPDNRYMYIANFGGTGDLSFVYPKGSYIGDPYIGLEGGIVYQGAHRWMPNRSDWVYDASGNILASSTIEFRINEPFLNEGGYTKLTTFGKQYQEAMIEQDITEVVNYSNGNNQVTSIAEKLGTYGTGNAIFYPKNQWISGTVANIKICQELTDGTIVRTTASPSQYTIFYDDTPSIQFSANAVPFPQWVEADYTAKNNINFKTHNGSILVSIENGSSPNFQAVYEIDEFVPKFVVVDNQQTSAFTPTADGISQQYNGLEYSAFTNRAIGMTVTSSVTPISGSVGLVTNGVEVNALAGDTTGNPLPVSSGGVTLPSGNQYVKIDLGAKYMVNKISVSHKYGADRIYKGTKTQVSEDGTNWVTVYDSAVSGTYNEKPIYHATHDHTHYAKFITFDTLPVRYVRDYANGWVSGDGLTSGNNNDWTEINVYGDWKLEQSYTYPSNSAKSGQQIATNGKGFVSTDIDNAYVAMNIPIEFTTWWYMTYVTGPEFGTIAIDMPSVMNQSHTISQESTYYNNVAHRHIMSLPPSVNIQQDDSKGIVAGTHRVVIRQESGKVTLDRLRFEDFQYYTRSSLLIPTDSSSTVFRRQKQVAEQAKWYEGIGRQSTEGAYDTVRVNAQGNPDKSVPIKYRVRFRVELDADGTKEERGIAYVTSAIFETGKQHTHWRRSEAVDIFPANRLETWDSNHPMKTGIQTHHIANGAILGSKLMPLSIMDYHISNYARISEYKLDLNYPTHRHGRMNTIVGAGPMGTNLEVWEDNLALLNTIEDWAGISGNYGTGNTMARGDHKHDGVYLSLTGGTVSNTTVFSKGLNSNSESHFSNGTYSDPSVGQAFGLKVSQGIATDKLNVLGNVVVSGNITITGTIDGTDVSNLNNSVNTISGNLYSHIGSGGSAHALAVSGGSNGFMSGADKAKLDGIQPNSINQATADSRYLELDMTNGNNTVAGKSLEHMTDSVILGNNDWTKMTYGINGNIPYYSDTYKGVTVSGSTWVTIRTRMPIDPQSTYYMRVRVSKKNGTGSFYGGAKTLDGNYNNLATDSANSYNYFCGAAVNIASGNSQIIEGTISGYNATSGSAYNKFDPEGKYFDIVLICNYQGSGETTIEALELYKNPEKAYVGSNVVWHTGSFDPSTKSDITHIHPNATSSGNGFMSSADKAKLDGMQSNSINQTTTDGLYLSLGGGTTTGNIVVSYAGLSATLTNNDLNFNRANNIAYIRNNASGGSLRFSVNNNILAMDIASGGQISAYQGLSVAGNISVTGTVDGVDVASLNTTVSNHIGSGGSAHALAVNNGSNGFMSGADKAKLDGIQSSAINQSTSDGRYVQLATNSTITADLTMNGQLHINKYSGGIRFDLGAFNNSVSGSQWWHGPNGAGDNILQIIKNGSGNSNYTWFINGSEKVWTSVTLGSDPATQTWANTNFYNKSTIDSKLVDATQSVHGFMSTSDKIKLDSVQSNSINQTTADNRYYIKNQSISVTADNTLIGADTGAVRLAIYKKSGYSPMMAVSSGGTFTVMEMNTNDLSQNISGTVGINNLLSVSSGSISYKSNTIWHAGNFDPSSKSDITHIHANVTPTSNGFMSSNDKSKLDGVENNANNYVHPTGAGNTHLPSGGSTGNFVKWSSNGVGTWTNVGWGDIVSKPLTFAPSAHTHVASEVTDLYNNIYNKTEVSNMVNARGDVFAGQATTFTNTNTFNKTGLSISIQPSASVTDATKLFQVSNTSGNELFSINYSGGVNIAGDLTVTGVQRFSGTTTVDGDYTVNGQLTAKGNTFLGDATTDLTTVSGDIKVLGQFKQINDYVEVHRRPIFGIAGDLQFQTDSTVFENIVDAVYGINSYALPVVKSGATRYYRVYVIYSDDITPTQGTAGQKATIRLSGGTIKDLDLARVGGNTDGRADWYSVYFTDLPTGNIILQAKLAQSGNNLGIRWVELIAYDRFES